MEKSNLVNSIPLVSIIIPAYNAEGYLSGAIESALNQSYINKEIIVIDDGSSDNSLAVALAFNDSITVLKQQNKGASAARNYGLSVAKGDFIQFLDGDDLLSADKIEKQVCALQNTTDKVALCKTIHFVDEATRLTTLPLLYEEAFIYTTDNPVDFMIRLWGGYDFNASMVQTNAWLVPRTLIDNFGTWNESLSLDDDGEFFARIILNSKGIIKTDGLNYYRRYRGSQNNLSATKTSKGYKSLFLSNMLKKEYLLKKTQSENAYKAAHKLLTELYINCFIHEPELCRSIKHELSTLPRYRYKIILGGRIINFMTDVFGWKAARKLQYLYANLTNKA